MATRQQLTSERQELENKIFADRIKLSQLKEGLTDRVWKGWYHSGRLQAIDSEGYYRDCGWAWGPGPEYPQDCYRNWKVTIAKDGVLEGESCKGYPLGSIGRGRLKNACGRNGSCHGGYFKCTAQPSATQIQISALESEISASLKRVADLDIQITNLILQEQLQDQFNIVRAEADAKIAAIRVEAEKIISEIRADYVQRDENVRVEADAKVMAARIEAEEMVQAVQMQAELTAEELRLDYARRDELIRAEAEAKIAAATAEERAIIRAETDAELAQYTTNMNAEIIAIKNTADARVAQAEIDAGNQIKAAAATADARIVQYREQTDAEIARIKAEANAEIERAKAEAEAQMETLRREAGVTPTIAPELAKWLPLLLIGGYLSIVKKPEEALAKKK